MAFLKTAFTSAALLGGGLFAMTPDNAGAQIRVRIGGGHSGLGYSQGGYGFGSGTSWGNAGQGYGGSGFRSNGYGYGSRHDGFSIGQRYGGSRGFSSGGWHDTSHYDYHPTSVVPHGNHYHVIPGHYDYHQSGHRH